MVYMAAASFLGVLNTAVDASKPKESLPGFNRFERTVYRQLDADARLPYSWSLLISDITTITTITAAVELTVI